MNNIRIKVPNRPKTLCAECTRARLRETTEGKFIISCAIYGTVNDYITRCETFHSRANTNSLNELIQIGLSFRISERGVMYCGVGQEAFNEGFDSVVENGKIVSRQKRRIYKRRHYDTELEPPKTVQ